MKSFVTIWLLLALAGLADAQAPESEAPQTSLQARRTAISAERTRLEAGFAAEDAACYDRFAVNNCLEKVNSRRRQAMAELRRQEISLNDEERKNRGEEQLRKTRDKSSPEKLQEASERRAKAAEDYQTRVEQAKSEQKERTLTLSGEEAARNAHAQKLKDRQQKAQTRIDKQSAAAEEVKKFNDRQQEAQARRARHEASQIDRPPAKPLPLPASPP